MYTNPGKIFIQTWGEVQNSDDVLRYAQFLRESANLGDTPPIDLDKIYECFGMPLPKLEDLPGQQGLLIPKKGQILLHSEDPLLRQRFTAAHELMEVLFAAMPKKYIHGARRYGNFSAEQKEPLCNTGGAELLMPRATFLPYVESLGVSYPTAEFLSTEYKVSLTAALVTMALMGPGRHIVVLWRWKNKPAELQNMVSENQLSMLSTGLPLLPAKRLRVEWAMANTREHYIPMNKSIPDDSCIVEAATTRVFTEGYEYLALGKMAGYLRSENWPFLVGDEWQVLSLLHLPGDNA